MSDPTSKQILALYKKFIIAEGRRTGAWARVTKTAKAWALMKTHGKYIDDRGGMCSVGLNDQKSYEEMFMQRLQSEALAALAEEACALDP